MYALEFPPHQGPPTISARLQNQCHVCASSRCFCSDRIQIPWRPTANRTVPCSVVSAASFDCAKSRTRVEKLVCESQELSRLDIEVGSAYDVVINSAPPIRRAGLIAEQKDRISNERAAEVDWQAL
jgi:hypothetical protein